MRLLHVAQDSRKDVLIDVRVGAIRGEHASLPVELLQQVGFQVRPAGDLQDLEERQQRGVMLDGIGALQKEASALEEVLEPQHGPDALDQRIFVGDHDRPGSSRENRRILPDSVRVDNTTARVSAAVIGQRSRASTT